MLTGNDVLTSPFAGGGNILALAGGSGLHFDPADNLGGVFFTTRYDGAGFTTITASGSLTTALTNTVTLGASPVSIAGTGRIAPASGTVPAVTAPAGTPGTLRNDGTLLSGGGPSGIGVALRGGGTLVNGASGLIQAYAGIVLGAMATVTNAGRITASNYYDEVRFQAGGQITNAAGGTILAAKAGASSGVGVNVVAGTGTLSNAGSIISTANAGVSFYNGGGVTNAAGGVIAGVVGVRAQYGSAVVSNAGTITGSGGSAIQLDPFQVNRVIDYAGAVFNGTVSGGNSGAYLTQSTLEFASSAATGTIAGLGSQFTGFGNFLVDANTN